MTRLEIKRDWVKRNLKVGDEFETFYSDGHKAEISSKITRINDKSVFHTSHYPDGSMYGNHETRQSCGTVYDLFLKCRYIKK